MSMRSTIPDVSLYLHIICIFGSFQDTNDEPALLVVRVSSEEYSNQGFSVVNKQADVNYSLSSACPISGLKVSTL